MTETCVASTSRGPSNTSLFFQLEEVESRASSDGEESIWSIQGKETDVAKDTSDTDSYASNVEYEPATEPEDNEQPRLESNYEDSSGGSDVIITTEVISVLVDDIEKGFADSEESSFGSSDSEIGPSDYWKCVSCQNRNNNPKYRFCEKCYKVRKNYFPSRPVRRHKKRKRSRDTNADVRLHDLGLPLSKRLALSQGDSPIGSQEFLTDALSVQPVIKSLSDPEVLFSGASSSQSSSGSMSGPEHKSDSESKKQDNQMCMTCMIEPKTGVFVHSRTAHICCCYKCARKVWELTKRCPMCNCKVNKILKAFIS